MLKSLLDHLNSIWENDASWCTIAETAISNLEIDHGITIKGSRGTNSTESPPLSVQQFQVEVGGEEDSLYVASPTSSSPERN